MKGTLVKSSRYVLIVFVCFNYISTKINEDWEGVNRKYQSGTA